MSPTDAEVRHALGDELEQILQRRGVDPAQAFTDAREIADELLLMVLHLMGRW